MISLSYIKKDVCGGIGDYFVGKMTSGKGSFG